jgi:hypothetical protein
LGSNGPSPNKGLGNTAFSNVSNESLEAALKSLESKQLEMAIVTGTVLDDDEDGLTEGLDNDEDVLAYGFLKVGVVDRGVCF